MSWDGAPAAPDAFALEFTLARGLAVAVLKTPSNARPGTCVAHLIAAEPGTLDGATTLTLYDSGGFRTTLDDPRYPTDRWNPPPKPLDRNGSAFTAAADAYLDLEWLPALLGYTLAHLSGRGPAVELHVEHATDALAMLRALYGILPRNSLRDLTFCTSTTPAVHPPAITAVTRDNPAAPGGERRIVSPGDRGDESDPFVQLGQQLVDYRRAGVAIPESLSTAAEIGQWCHRRHLRSRPPAELDDDSLAEVIADPELSPDWFRDQTVASRAVALAIGRPSAARALAAHDQRPGVRRTFEQLLTDRILADGPDRARTVEVARLLDLDMSDALAAAAWARLTNGSGPLTPADAESVWPRLRKDWATGDHERRRVIAGYLLRHRTLREHSLESRDRALVYETLNAEVDDPGVHTADSRILRSAMYTNLAIVAQLVVNVSCNGRDRYALDQILACAPTELLPTLIAEAARYPALDTADLLKALTLSRSEPAELVAALRPAWRTLRRPLHLPEPIEALVTLAVPAPEPESERGGIRLPRLPFGRLRRTSWSRTELSDLIHTPATDRPAAEYPCGILSAALTADPEYVVAELVSRSKAPDAVPALRRILAFTPPDRLPTLLTECARRWDLPHPTLLHAVAALNLPPVDLTDTLSPAWPWLRTRFDLPRAIAPLLTLDPADTLPPAAKPLPDDRNSRRTRWFRH
ncbi:hypothetical protein [Nocardia seriolae]|uniref:Uncharacterized protein n=1 Tax=Nocardia seriolae TaxID=37332 RepID=A0ABC9Z483_9NOCA|nr:hypothetical protein [Nocardia seriolae]BEK97830.1 hypothetical protein NSER024013_57360 [Nocardia seriolae]GAM50384.1 hypothetical protein NS07_v2contig00150-0013 [Nocardia seriolae]GAP32335.1 hypothetical protein NSK11_contig00152-0014 [Nocardia seriolae]